MILLIELSALYLGELSETYKRIDIFHKEHTEGKKITKKLKEKERNFLEELNRELEQDVEDEHMAMI